jgi:hypothetical protein
VARGGNFRRRLVGDRGEHYAEAICLRRRERRLPFFSCVKTAPSMSCCCCGRNSTQQVPTTRSASQVLAEVGESWRSLTALSPRCPIRAWPKRYWSQSSPVRVAGMPSRKLCRRMRVCTSTSVKDVACCSARWKATAVCSVHLAR